MFFVFCVLKSFLLLLSLLCIRFEFSINVSTRKLKQIGNLFFFRKIFFGINFSGNAIRL
jgi:hypothetical protein